MGHNARILWTLGSLNNWVAQNISDQVHRFQNGQWYYPHICEALADAGLCKVGYYSTRHHNSVYQYTSTRTIFDIVMAEERQPVSPTILLWWGKDGISFMNGGRGADESEVGQ